IWRAPAGAPFCSKPKGRMFQGQRHEWAHRPIAAEVPVRPGDKSLGPICDGAKCIAIAFRELPRPTRVLEILKEEEIGGLCWHGYPPSEALRAMVLLVSAAPRRQHWLKKRCRDDP